MGWILIRCSLLQVLHCRLGRNPGLIPRTCQQFWLFILIIIGILVGADVSGEQGSSSAAFAHGVGGILRQQLTAIGDPCIGVLLWFLFLLLFGI